MLLKSCALQSLLSHQQNRKAKSNHTFLLLKTITLNSLSIYLSSLGGEREREKHTRGILGRVQRMDRDSGSQPLLRRTSSSSRERKRSGSGRLSLSRRNSVNALRHEFVSKLPEKVLAGIDAEAPFDVDTSKTIALSEGIAACSLLVFVGGLFSW